MVYYDTEIQSEYTCHNLPMSEIIAVGPSLEFAYSALTTLPFYILATKNTAKTNVVLSEPHTQGVW